MEYRRSPRDRFLAMRGGDFAVAAYVVGAIVIPDGTFASQVLRVLLVVVAALDLAVKPFRVWPLLLWQIMFIIYVWWSVSWAFSAAHAESMVSTVTVNGVCLVFLGFLLVDDAKRVRLVIACMTIAPILLLIRVGVTDGFLVFLQTRTTDDAQANFVGMAGAFGFGLAYLCASQRIIMARWIAATLIAGNLAVALISASRKAVVMLILILLLFTLLNRSAGVAVRSFRVISTVLVGVVGYWLIMNVKPLYDTVGYRMAAMIDGFVGDGNGVDASTATRLGLIDRGMAWFQESPWLGHGANNFKALMEAYYPGQTAFYAHNNFVEILVNFGIVGFLLFYWLYAVIILVGLRKMSSMVPTQAMLLALLVTLLLMEYGQVDYYNRFFMAFVAIAWVAVCTRTLDAENEVPTRSLTLSSSAVTARIRAKV